MYFYNDQKNIILIVYNMSVPTSEPIESHRIKDIYLANGLKIHFTYIIMSSKKKKSH